MAHNPSRILWPGANPKLRRILTISFDSEYISSRSGDARLPLSSSGASSGRHELPCDANTDGSPNVSGRAAGSQPDIGVAMCTADINKTVSCNVIASSGEHAALGGNVSARNLKSGIVKPGLPFEAFTHNFVSPRTPLFMRFHTM